MHKFLISEGYITLMYIDEVTMLEKKVLAPKYSFDILADNIHVARHICAMMELGVEETDFMIFRRDKAVLGKDFYKTPKYMLN